MVNPLLLAVVVSGLFQASIIIGITCYLWWRVRVFTCPNCESKVSREHIQFEEVSCPDCGWQAQRVLRVPKRLESPQLSGECHRCDCALEAITGVRMWDGHAYCQNCVDEVSPALWNYALQHPVVSETLPYSTHRYFWRTFAILDLSIMGIFGTLLLLGSLLDGGLVQGLSFTAAFQLFALPFAIVFAGGQAAGFAMHRPSIQVADGELTLQLGNMSSETTALEHYEWFHGDLSKFNMIDKVTLPSQPVILLVIPQHDEDNEKYVAVGFDERMRVIWSSFFTLAGLKRREV